MDAAIFCRTMKNIFVAFLCVATLLITREIFLLPDGKLHLHMFDVGQGDSFLIITPQGKHVLIDGGPNLKTLEHLGRHMPFFDRSLELVILTHPDSDHITAIPEISKRYTIENILLSGAVHNSGRYEELLHSVINSDTNVILPDPQKTITIDGVALDILWPPTEIFGTDPRSQNNQSIVIRMLYGHSSILFTGDIERQAERAILATGADIHADIMTAPHHGSKTSSSTGFILEVNPSLVLISAGRDNRYGHPHTEITDRYAALGIPIKTTPIHGTVSLEFDHY